MRVLIISHNCINTTTNMGKTLLSYFHEFPREDIAQLYIHCEEPTDGSICQNYFRFTDLDAVKSMLCPKCQGQVFGKQDIRTGRGDPRTDTGLLRAAYRYGEQRRAFGYGLRELLWKFSRWDTEKLHAWLENFRPEVVFFASGDYGFSYEIARTIARKWKIPLAVCCVDEYYLHNRNAGSALGRWVHGNFLKQVYRTMDYASGIFTICEPLKALYVPMFGKECTVLHTSAQDVEEGPEKPRQGIAYLGKLELGREKQLVDIGRTLQKLDLPGGPKYLDVYSWDRSRQATREMTPENGIVFHGGVSSENVQEILKSSVAVVHTESFDPKIQQIVRYSISAKIPESLMAGSCLIAYGPEGIASMDYLKTYDAAYFIPTPEKLEQGLREILTEKTLQEQLRRRAKALGQENHSVQKEPERLRERLEQICRDWERAKSLENRVS